MPHPFPRHRLAIATGIVLVAGAVAAPAAATTVPAAVQAAAVTKAVAGSVAAPSPARLHDDFNGDGYPDVAIGADEARGFHGAVSVLYGGPGGLSKSRKQILTWPDRSGLAVPGRAEYGEELATGDLNGDGYADLVSTLDSPPADGDRGTTTAVNWGGAGGLAKNATVLRSLPGDQDASGGLAVGDVDGDRKADIVLTDEYGGGHVLRGPVSRAGVWSGATPFDSGLNTGPGALPAIGDVTGDGVGDLALVGRGQYAAVVVLPGGRRGFGTPVEIRDAAGGTVAGGGSVGIADLNRDGHGDVVVGTPVDAHEGDRPVRKGGAVLIAYGGAAGQSTALKPVWIHQDTPGVPGTGESGDSMGSALALGDTNADGYPDVLVGLPAEHVSGKPNTGRVLALKGGRKGVSGTGAKEFGQYTAGVPGTTETNDVFGAAVSLGEYAGKGRAQAVIGAPRENARQGAIWILRADSTGLVARGSVSFGAATIGAPTGASLFGGRLTD
ncbi:VCBS repeat-containing protein [Streptomyces sp. CAU 1734]|uniref:FG-GAP repeat domain-containing protein n=1 Tax=Streptomyces sp. CAU 1734 TaxID=3140360 RepID=UPI003261ABD5